MENGELEYIGRNDFQVKVRGFRIELREVEFQLKKIASIENCQVICTQVEPLQEKCLVAYFITKNNQEVNLEYLRSCLMKFLPEYMIPAYFVKLDKFPLTINGKIDTRSFPLPRSNCLLPTIDYSQQELNETENKLLAIWKEVLKLPEVNLHGSFFEMGGNSLLLMQLKDLLDKNFSKKIAIPEIFNHPTVYQMAKFYTLDAEIAEDKALIKRKNKRQSYLNRMKNKHMDMVNE